MAASAQLHDARERQLLHWVSRHLGTTRHERRVVELASDLFDVLGEHHDLGGAERRLLRWGAVVHDVGRSVCADDDHAAEGAWMILAERDSLPLTSRERRRLAYLTLYHRGRVPAPGCDAVLHPAEDDPRQMHCLLAMLRAADTLDRRRSLSSMHVDFSLSGGSRRRRLTVSCHAPADEVSAIRLKKFRLLEETLGLQIQLCAVDYQDTHRRAA